MLCKRNFTYIETSLTMMISFVKLGTSWIFGSINWYVWHVLWMVSIKLLGKVLNRRRSIKQISFLFKYFLILWFIVLFYLILINILICFNTHRVVPFLLLTDNLFVFYCLTNKILRLCVAHYDIGKSCHPQFFFPFGLSVDLVIVTHGFNCETEFVVAHAMIATKKCRVLIFIDNFNAFQYVSKWNSFSFFSGVLVFLNC
jgi:hypothetical protein